MISTISVYFVGSNGAATLQLRRLTILPVQKADEDHASNGRKIRPFGAVEGALLVRKDEFGMVAIERLGAANIPLLLENMACVLTRKPGGRTCGARGKCCGLGR
jgi:hypothetical protein